MEREQGELVDMVGGRDSPENMQTSNCRELRRPRAPTAVL